MTSEREAPRALIAAHGDLAAGLVSAVEQIAGLGDMFVALSNRDLSGETLLASLRAAVDAHGLQVVFTDLPAGSATMATRRLQRERDGLILVCGVNLATLLEFAMQPSDVSPADAAHASVERGRQSLTVAAGGPRVA
jgi:PTS system N-acetylgalactosamine-specific IIA component